MIDEVITKILQDLTAIPRLTHKQLETQGCILSPTATDALVLKHQVISIYSTD